MRGIMGWALIFLEEDWLFFVIIMALFSLTVKTIFWRLVEKKIIITWIVLFGLGVILFFAVAGYWFNGNAFL